MGCLGGLFLILATLIVGEAKMRNEQVCDPLLWYGLRGRLVVMIPLKGHGGSDI